MGGRAEKHRMSLPSSEQPCGSSCLLLRELPTSFQNIFVWCGGKSNILERNKARDLALAIRDSERQGKAQVEIVTDGEEPAEMIQVEGDFGLGGPCLEATKRSGDQLGGMRVASGGR